MVLINSTTSPILCAALARPCTVAPDFAACATAVPVMRVDSATCRPISDTEDDNSSVADATVCTLVEACSEAAATAADLRLDSSALEANVLAAVCRLAAEPPTESSA